MYFSNFCADVNKSSIYPVSCHFLSACAGRRGYETPHTKRTPTVQKFAKRAYNKPYKIKGKQYRPQKHYDYREVGIASYYGGRDIFHGRKTSNGEIFDKNGLTAAHKTLPIPSVIRVTNLKNGRSIKLKVNDRGPFKKGRIVDVSMRAAQLLGFYKDGLAKVRVETCMNDTLRVAHRGSARFDPQLTQVSPPKKPILNKKSSQIFLTKKTAGQGLVGPRSRSASKAPVNHSKILSTAARSPRNGIFIQTARASSLDEAKKRAGILLKKYPQVGVRVAPHQDGRYRVLLGPFRSSQEAKNLVTSISSGNAG